MFMNLLYKSSTTLTIELNISTTVITCSLVPCLLHSRAYFQDNYTPDYSVLLKYCSIRDCMVVQWGNADTSHLQGSQLGPVVTLLPV